jgi:hypothetical protein
MKTLLGVALAAASLTVPAPAAAAAQPAPAARTDDPAKAAEAHAIVEIMYPPPSRQEMMEKMLAGMMAPLHQNMGFLNQIKDPGLKDLFKGFFDGLLDQQRLLMSRHLPAMMDAMAAAYSHMFTLAELKDIHAFAESPTGRIYFSRMPNILSDPVVQKVSGEMMADAQQSMKGQASAFKDKIAAYVKAHPEAADELKAMGQSKASSGK